MYAIKHMKRARDDETTFWHGGDVIQYASFAETIAFLLHDLRTMQDSNDEEKQQQARAYLNQQDEVGERSTSKSQDLIFEAL